MLSAETAESGHPEMHYKVVHSTGEPVVELRFQIPEGTRPARVNLGDYVSYVVLSPSEKTYRFASADLFARAAEYKKARYHRLEDF
jgi:hypothetical protein